MTRFCIAIAVSLLVGGLTEARANGALAEFPAGGVVFRPSQEISIAREDLEIGWDRIRVRYVFHSIAPQPIEGTLGFPLAKVPQDDSPDGFQSEGRNYMNFEVSVDGKPVDSTPHEYAWLGETDITAKLDEMGVPVFAATPEAFEALARLPAATVERLKAEELVDENGSWLVPRWSYQAVYEWTQTFAPGATEVEISYAPRFGATSEYSTYYPGGEGAQDYCLDEAVKQKLSGDVQPQPFTVGYILTTARNWNGPIGEFNLKIVNTDSIASLCVPAGLTATDEGWTGKDFVPEADLKVLFFHGVE